MLLPRIELSDSPAGKLFSELKKLKQKEMNMKELFEANSGYHTRLQADESDYKEVSSSQVLKLGEWGYMLDPKYMVQKKIKQRQLEYWKRRIRKDYNP